MSRGGEILFTVVICSTHIKKSIEERYSYILESLLDDKAFAICPWNVDGDTLEEALPTLQSLIGNKYEWRAVIIQDGQTFGRKCIDKRNPFDFVGTLNNVVRFGNSEDLVSGTETVDSIRDKILDFRRRKVDNYRKATENPLTKLAIWLSGSPMANAPEYYSTWTDTLTRENAPITEEYFEQLDACFTSSEEVELTRALFYKYDILSEKFMPDAMLEKKPKSIVVISERSDVCQDEIFRSAWNDYEELEYSNFCDDNMYPSGLRYILCDVEYENHIRRADSYLSFLLFLILAAQYEIPHDRMQPYKVYNAKTVMETDNARQIFSTYFAKLELTRRSVGLRMQNEHNKSLLPVKNADVQSDFISDTTVTVTTETEFDRSRLMAQYDIGLAKDCPRDEYNYWYEQYRNISKLFIRYLREPRRAVKSAVKGTFRRENKIVDDRAISLNENQVEDIELRLLEEEQNMVETVTTQLFNTAAYRERMAEADEQLKRKISERMSKKKTVTVGLVALLAYFIGFLPLFFTSLNSFKSLVFSFDIALVMMGLLACVGFISLFVFRRQLINVFKHFNYVMHDICDEIENGMRQFGKYLTHACNVMREFYVLKKHKEDTTEKYRILRYHYVSLENKIAEVNELFFNFINFDTINLSEITSYDFDFTVLRDYVYEIPNIQRAGEVEFIEPGNIVSLPVDYVKSVTLTMEDLYD